MRRILPRCEQCGTVLREREQYCRECGATSQRKDKDHALVDHRP